MVYHDISVHVTICKTDLYECIICSYSLPPYSQIGFIPGNSLLNLRCSFHQCLTRALMGLWIFHHLMVGVLRIPLVTQLLDVVARNQNCVRKLFGNNNVSVQSIFH